ncbi:MAG: HPF/RaiA family ribosome-associated protein [Verrucomicrobiota bacterium]
MYHETPPEVILSGIHFAPTPSLKALVLRKTERLFRREERIIRIRIELDREQKRPGYVWFVAKGHVISYGPEMNASASSDRCVGAVMQLIDKLERMLRHRAALLKGKRNHPHAIELGAALPKAV